MHRFEYVTVNICESKELFLMSSEVNIAKRSGGERAKEHDNKNRKIRK